MPAPEDLPAGDFSAWLERTLHALASCGGTDVDCGTCTACCTSSYFILIEPDEQETKARIDRRLLSPAPGMPGGHVLLGYDSRGRCPLIGDARCAIYEHRPRTCRAYDCRVFTAAGIAAGGADKQLITRRAQRWKFTYPTQRDRDEHAAVRAASSFIRNHPESFPGGRTPDNPSQLAILALKASRVFLRDAAGAPHPSPAQANASLAQQVVKACRAFDARKLRAAKGQPAL